MAEPVWRADAPLAVCVTAAVLAESVPEALLEEEAPVEGEPDATAELFATAEEFEA